MGKKLVKEDERARNERGRCTYCAAGACPHQPNISSLSPHREKAGIPVSTNHVCANKTHSKLNHPEEKDRRLNYKPIGLRNGSFRRRPFLQG